MRRRGNCTDVLDCGTGVSRHFLRGLRYLLSGLSDRSSSFGSLGTSDRVSMKLTRMTSDAFESAGATEKGGESVPSLGHPWLDRLLPWKLLE